MYELSTHAGVASYVAPNRAIPLRSSVWHHFTIDVEEYFQVSALESHVPRTQWDTMESRVERSMERLLAFMEDTGVRATCFVLSWIAERHPQMVRSIADSGHEVASHGTDHRRVTQLTPADFRESVRRSKSVLEDLLGRPVIGYRAPSFSIVVGREWALDILVEEGYRYDSSLYPIWRPDEYGYARTNPDPHWLVREAGPLLEIPPNTLRVLGARLPAGGGAYFRVLPTAFARAALQDCQRRGIPGTFYIHPWELDPDQPVFNTSAFTRFRHYTGLANTEGRLRKLVRGFAFEPISTTFATLAHTRGRAPTESTSEMEHNNALQREAPRPTAF